MTTQLSTREQFPAPLFGRADPDLPPWVAAGPAAGHRADGGGRAVADAWTVQGVLLNPVCQKELFNPGRDVSINPDYNPILTPQRPVPDVRLGYASTGQKQEVQCGRNGPLLATSGHSDGS